MSVASTRSSSKLVQKSAPAPTGSVTTRRVAPIVEPPVSDAVVGAEATPADTEMTLVEPASAYSRDGLAVLEITGFTRADRRVRSSAAVVESVRGSAPVVTASTEIVLVVVTSAATEAVPAV